MCHVKVSSDNNLSGIGVRASLFVEEVQGGSRRRPGQLGHSWCDALVQVPQAVMKQAPLLLV